MKALVIGRNGQVAQALVERAAGTGIAVDARGRPDVDLADPATLAPALDDARPDIVINAAAYTAVDAAESDEAAAHALNAAGPGALAALCAERGLPLIHLSTDYVFDGKSDRPYREDDPVGPQGAYGRTKLAGEELVAASGARALILRTAWVYSPFGGNFVKTMLRVGKERDALRVVADQFGNPTSALDIADGVLALAKRADQWGDGAQIYHMVGAGETSWHGFAEGIFALAPFSPSVEGITTAEYPTPAKRPANSRLETARLAADHNVALPHWRESLPGVVARILAA
ncbi:dTDP-4-dehydrorhamnose reductase [Acuticoccus sp. MNP-M23]|uniref:dTDP-4-dehydrorhamnose reductase n=1 Tax=Acuticoccus sp. MNP-M23 TaxID=3072793 RepID=UPI002815529C|nr:dTDP-4-dehydrorhamnose reductase [Acuticoccus sp. MNP-M23]WMS41035.1 dTDP-4-dehydrorhamnose reductase [Acuticoccus sp. MNP-M23]